MDFPAGTRVAVVGSRSRPCRDAVRDVVRLLAQAGCTIVTGGARGVDSWAEEAAREFGAPCVVHRPAIPPGADRHEAVRLLMERNSRIVDDADAVMAFPGGTGGTWDTVRKAHAAGKRVILL